MKASLRILFAVALVAVTAPSSPAQDRVAAAIAQLDKLAAGALEKTGVPGIAIVVVHRDRVVYAKGFGVREAGKAGPVDADTVFMLASVSKPITSTILAILVGLGIIDWDSRVSDLDPAFQLRSPWTTRELTLRDLLCHRSGLADHEGDLLEDMGYSRAEVLHRLRFAKPASSFRSAYAYTNFGITEAAVAAAKPTGKAWDTLAAEHLYKPLGMTRTSSRFADYAAAENRAVLHEREDGKWAPRRIRDADAQSPAGGVSSTANDLGRWLRLQLASGAFDGKQIAKASALAETHRPQIVTHPPANPSVDRAGFYGLCWNVGYDDRGRVRLNHSGAFDTGAATFVGLAPADDLGIAVLTNVSPIGVPEAIGVSFLDLAQNGSVEKDYFALFAKAFAVINAPAYASLSDAAKKPKTPAPPLPPGAYVGTFHNDYYGPIEVAEGAKGLEVRMGPRKLAFAMRPWHRDVFAYQPTGEMSAGPAAVTFTIGVDGRATAVTLENLNVTGQGVFLRKQ